MRRARTDLALAVAAVLAVTAPLLFTRSGFAVDFTNALWLVQVAGHSLVEVGHPSFFIDSLGSTIGAFDPWFAFYGGSLYMLTGGIAELIGGHPEIAFVGVTMLAVAGAYGGVLWLGRELGLRGWTAHAPALAVITSAYYITNIYGRGAWPEVLATSVIAPLVAGGVHLVRAPTWRPLPVAIFALSTAIFTGSHNITLLWGTTVAAATLSVMWLALGAPRRLPYRRLAMVAGLGLASSLVNAWFLLPDLAYAADTRLGSAFSHLPTGGEASIWPTTSFFQTPAVLLDPLRTVPPQSTTPALYVQAPDWFLAWGLAAGALLLWRGSPSRTSPTREPSRLRPSLGALRRAWVGVVGVVALLLGMMTVAQFWNVVPYPFSTIQFPYRLGSYLFYAVAGLVLVGALALERAAAAGGPRRLVKGLRLALVAVCAVSLGLCLWQQWVPSTLFPGVSYSNRGEALLGANTPPRTWYDRGAYHDGRAPIVSVPPERLLIVEPSQVHGDRFAAWVDLPPGPEPIQTNIAGGDYLVRLHGLRWLGRNPAGYAVVGRIDRRGGAAGEGGLSGAGPVYVTIEAQRSPLIELGEILSIIGVLAVLGVLVWTSVHARRARTPARNLDFGAPAARGPSS